MEVAFNIESMVADDLIDTCEPDGPRDRDRPDVPDVGGLLATDEGVGLVTERLVGDPDGLTPESEFVLRVKLERC